MANIKIEGIQYSNLENALTNGITGIGSSKIGDPTNKITRLEEGDIPAKVVNAVEIDWNGMVLGDKTINTIGELLSA